MAQRSNDSMMDDDFEYDNDYAQGESKSFTEQLDIQHYLRILRKFKWLIALFTAVVTALAGYFAYTATPEYRATATMVMLTEGGGIVGFEEFVGLDTSSQDYFQTQVEILKGASLSRRVVDVLQLWNHPELNDSVVQSVPTSASNAQQGPFANLVASAKEFLGFQDIPANQAQVNNEDAAQNTWQNTSLDESGQTPRRELTGVQVPEGAGSRAFNPDPLVSDARSTTVLQEAADALVSTVNRTALLTREKELSAEEKKIVQRFSNRISISPVRKTEMIRISFESADPALAALVANTLGEQYIIRGVEDKLRENAQVATQLNDRLGELKTILDESEDRLVAFKEANGLVDVDGSVGRLNEQELLLVTAELAQARSDLSAQSNLYREVQNLAGRPELLQSIPAIQADPLVQRTKIDQGQAQRTLDELLNRYGERHPRVVDATSQLATLNTTLEGHLNRVVGAISNDFQLATQRVSSIEAKLASGKQEIQALGTKKFELDELEREVQTNRNIYDTYFNQIAQSKSVDGLSTVNARIAEYAFSPVTPFKPKKELIIALAALSSLILSMLMAFLYEQMDDTVKSTNDIEEKLGVKLLGILPLIKGGVFSKGQTLPLNPLEIPDKLGRFNECVNTARTALCMGDGKQGRKIITVTSSVPGEGKSTTSINLAFSLAQMEKVLLIDCDMRRPTVAKAAGYDKNTTGLSSLIAGVAPARECIKRGAFDGAMDILPSGPLPEQPLELLSSKRFEKILAGLSQHYDRIIIDSAPIQAVSDGLVLGRFSDAVVYCVKSHETSIELVKRGVARIRQAGVPLAGVIITQVDVDKITAYGGDYYYQGYYDYYGYNDDANSGKHGSKLRLSNAELIKIRTDETDFDLGMDHGYDTTRRASNVDDFHLEDEFDMTARVENSGRATGGVRRVATGNKRDTGLDIL